MAVSLDDVAAKVEAGEKLSDEDVQALESGRDIITLGMLADSVRRKLHGTNVTFVRVFDLKLSAGSLERADVPPAAGEVRIFETPQTLDAAVSIVTDARDLAGATPLSAFCLFELSKLPEGLPVVLPALKRAGLELITQAPLDRLASPEHALEAVTDAGLQLARLTINETIERKWTDVCREVSAHQRRLQSLRAFAPLPRKIDQTQPATGYSACQTRGPVATADSERRHHPGGLGALWAEAGAGGADLRRRRRRFSVRHRRRLAGTSSLAAGRNPAQHSSRVADAGGKRRALQARVVMPPFRACPELDSPGCRQLSQYRSAGVRSRAAARSVSDPLRRAVALRGAAAREAGGSRADSVNRVSPRRRLSHRAGRGDCVGRAGGVGGAVQQGACCTRHVDRARQQLAHVGGASLRDPVRAMVEAGTGFRHPWRPTCRRCWGSAMRRWSSAITRCLPNTSGSGWRRSISGRSGLA